MVAIVIVRIKGGYNFKALDGSWVLFAVIINSAGPIIGLGILRVYFNNIQVCGLPGT